jgi:hypothetical protein
MCVYVCAYAAQVRWCVAGLCWGGVAGPGCLFLLVVLGSCWAVLACVRVCAGGMLEVVVGLCLLGCDGVC